MNKNESTTDEDVSTTNDDGSNTNDDELDFEVINEAIKEPDFKERLLHAISFAWNLFQSKVALGEVKINKEASMQLAYSMTLERVLPLFLREIEKGEKATIILEMTNVTNNEKRWEDVRKANKNLAPKEFKNTYREIDMVLRGYHPIENDTGTNQYAEINIAVEMKCYKTKSSTGGSTGAQNLFERGIYLDLERLEEFCDVDCSPKKQNCPDKKSQTCIQNKSIVFDAGVALVMTDYDGFLTPHACRSGKNWAFQIHDTACAVGKGKKDDPDNLTGIYQGNIGQDYSTILFKESHDFHWVTRGNFHFLKCFVGKANK